MLIYIGEFCLKRCSTVTSAVFKLAYLVNAAHKEKYFVLHRPRKKRQVH